MLTDAARAVRQNYGLRLAFAVAFGLVFEILRGALLPPLAPVIALQLLALPGPPPGAKKVVGLFGIMAIAALLAYAVAALTVSIWVLYALGTGLLYLWGFWLATQPKTAGAGALFLTMAIVVTAMSAVSTGLAIFLVFELLGSVLLGIGLVFLAHALFPHRDAPGAQPAPPEPAQVPPLTRALLASAIILPLHLALTAEGGTALVVLMTVATMLRQPRLRDTVRYGAAFAIGNLLGGILAACVVLLASLHDHWLVFASLAAAGALAMSWHLDRAPRLRPILLPGYVAFTLLVGLAYVAASMKSPGEVTYLTRVMQIVFAAVYTLAGVSLCLPLLTRRRAPEPAPT